MHRNYRNTISVKLLLLVCFRYLLLPLEFEKIKYDRVKFNRFLKSYQLCVNLRINFWIIERYRPFFRDSNTVEPPAPTYSNLRLFTSYSYHENIRSLNIETNCRVSLENTLYVFPLVRIQKTLTYN